MILPGFINEISLIEWLTLAGTISTAAAAFAALQAARLMKQTTEATIEQLQESAEIKQRLRRRAKMKLVSDIETLRSMLKAAADISPRDLAIQLPMGGASHIPREFVDRFELRVLRAMPKCHRVLFVIVFNIRSAHNMRDRVIRGTLDPDEAAEKILKGFESDHDYLGQLLMRVEEEINEDMLGPPLRPIEEVISELENAQRYGLFYKLFRKTFLR